jgi:hypothetical protein
LNLLQTTQEKLPEAARLFDLSKHWFRHRFTLGVDRRSDLGLQFPSHAVHPRRSLKDSTDRADLASYVTKYPQGEFLDLAQRRLDKMANPVAATAAAAPVVATPKLSQTGLDQSGSPALLSSWRGT